MLYTAWPDYGVPQSANALLQFLSLVRQQQHKLLASRGDTWAGHPRGPPIVVHCSAGIGRTGEETSFTFKIILSSTKASISYRLNHHFNCLRNLWEAHNITHCHTDYSSARLQSLNK